MIRINKYCNVSLCSSIKQQVTAYYLSRESIVYPQICVLKTDMIEFFLE